MLTEVHVSNCAQGIFGDSLLASLLMLDDVQYDIVSLKEKASNDIKSKLSPGNILEELFSTFTSLCVRS